ncbi:hypothetical protein BKA70DRAFT_1498961 [Coprinopsis sp. MPI-PUGE-AT-0042]|nr:hypothetical protein BKA70DRAFT_1498961 [Coprinopsis sp. MPI-PUGE-AT-0042]
MSHSGDSFDESDAHTESNPTTIEPGGSTLRVFCEVKIYVCHGSPYRSGFRDLRLEHLRHPVSESGTRLQKSYFDNIDPEGFTVHLNSYGRTRIYDAWLDYLVLEATNPLLQSGSIDSQNYRISKVCVALTGVGISGKTSWEIRTFATQVDSCGFTLHIEKKRDIEQGVYQALRICSGEIRNNEGMGMGKPVMMAQGYSGVPLQV